MSRAAFLGTVLLLVSLVPTSHAQRLGRSDSSTFNRTLSEETSTPEVQLVGQQAAGAAILTSGAFVEFALESGVAITAKVIDVVREDGEPIRYRFGDKDGNPLPGETLRDVRRMDTSAGDLLITAITGDPTSLVMEVIRVSILNMQNLFNETIWETVDLWQSQRLKGNAEIEGQNYTVDIRARVGKSGVTSNVLVRLDVVELQPSDLNFDVPVEAEIGISFGPLALRVTDSWSDFSNPGYVWIKQVKNWIDIEDQLRNNPIQGKVFVRKDPLFWFEKQIGTVSLLPGEAVFPPSRPQLATTSNQNSVSLSLQGSAESFEIYRAEQSGFSIEGREPLAVISESSYEDDGVVPGKKYYYRAVAVSSIGKKSNPSRVRSGRAQTNLRIQNLSVGDAPIHARSRQQVTGKLETVEGGAVEGGEILLTIPEVDWTYEKVTTDANGNFALPYRAPTKEGNYQAELNARAQGDVRVRTKVVGVSPPSDAGRDLRIQNLSVEDSISQAGGTFQTTLDLTNNGDQSEQAQLSYHLLNRTGDSLTSAQRSVSINSGNTTQLSATISVPTGLSEGGYTLTASATTPDGLDERRADNVVRRDVYVASEEGLSATFETQRDTLAGIGESIEVGGTTVTLEEVENSSAAFQVDGESTGTIPVGEIWLSSAEDFFLTPKSIASADTVVAVRVGPSTGQAGVTPNRQVAKRGHVGTYQVQTPPGSSIQLSSLMVVNGSDDETLQAWNSDASNTLIDDREAKLNFLVPSNAETREYSGWLRWSDGETRYFKHLALRAAPIHDFELSDLQLDNGSSVPTLLPGMDIEVSADVINQGDFTEKVDVALEVMREDSVVYRDSEGVQVAKRPSPPESGEEVRVSLTWPTVGLDQGTYDVRVSMSHSEDETPDNDLLTTTAELTEPQPLTVDVLEFPEVHDTGDSIHVRASVTQEEEIISDATAYAFVTRPDGSTEEVDLSYDPDEELYEGTLFADHGGNYDVRATANQRFATQGSGLGMAQAYVDVSVSTAFSSLLFSRRGGVEMQVSNVGGLYGVAADITYEGSQVAFKEIRELPFLSAGGEVETALAHSDEGGRVVTGLTRLDPDAGGATTSSQRRLFSLSFAGIANGSTTFGLENVQLTDAEGDTMAVRVNPTGPASFEISSQEAALAANTLDSTATLNETDTTDLVISNTYNLKGVDGQITFNPNKVEVEDILEGTALGKDDGETLFVKNIDNEAGEAGFAVTRQGEGAGVSTGTDQVVRVLYRPTSTGTVQFDWSHSALIAAESELGMPHFTSGDSITVTTGGDTVDSARVAFSPSEVSPPEGEEFTLAATVEEVTDLFSVATSISFDPAQLDTVDIQEGDFLSEGGDVSTSFTHQVDEETGTITIGLSRLGSDVGGVSTTDPDTLFTLQFARTGEEESAVEYFNTGLLLPDGETEIPFVADKAEIRGSLRVLRPIPDDTLKQPGPTYQLTDLDKTVFGGTGDNVLLSATSSAPSVVGVADSDSQNVALRANSIGTAEVAVTASEGQMSSTTSFSATVIDRPQEEEVPVEHATAVVDAMENDSVEVGFGRTGTEVVFRSVTTGGLAKASFFRSDSSSSGAGPAVASTDSFANVSQYRWRISGKEVTFDSLDVRFALGDTSITGVGAPKNVHIIERKEGSETFQPVHTLFTDQGTPADSTDDRLIARGLTKLGTFKLASDDPANPLPVELTSFDAERDEETVVLTWQTASEQRNAGFEVQRARSGSDGSWTKLGFVESNAEDGTTNKPQSYRFTDEGPPFAADKLRYRLRQVDLGGTEKLTEVVAVEQSVRQIELLDVFPNPAQSWATVRYALPEKQEVSLKLYDVLGRQVRTAVRAEQKGRQEVRLNTSGLPSGVYFLRFQAGGVRKTQRLTVLR